MLLQHPHCSTLSARDSIRSHWCWSSQQSCKRILRSDEYQVSDYCMHFVAEHQLQLLLRYLTILNPIFHPFCTKCLERKTWSPQHYWQSPPLEGQLQLARYDVRHTAFSRHCYLCVQSASAIAREQFLPNTSWKISCASLGAAQWRWSTGRSITSLVPRPFRARY